MPTYAWWMFVGTALGLGTLVFPIFLPPPESLESKGMLIRITDHGLSLAAILLAIGIINLDVSELGLGSWGWGRSPFDGIVGLLFAFAGWNSWSKARR